MNLLSPLSIAFYVGWWILIVLAHFLATGTFKWHRFSFSVRNYHLLMAPFVIAAMAIALGSRSLRPIEYFALFAIAGVIGELIVSVWWRAYFAQRFWVYEVDTFDHAYSSWLNLIPWAVGGSIYLVILTTTAAISDPRYSHLGPLAVVVSIVLLALQDIVFRVVRGKDANQKFRSVTFLSGLVFFWPMAAFILLMALVYGSQVLWLTLLFGIVAMCAEYLFGKATEFFLSKKLWRYEYLAVDNGHFTPLSFPFFALGGFYFWLITALLQNVLR